MNHRSPQDHRSPQEKSFEKWWAKHPARHLSDREAAACKEVAWEAWKEGELFACNHEYGKKEGNDEQHESTTGS